MRIGTNLTGLSLLLPLSLIASILAVRCLAIRYVRAPNTFSTWIAAAAGGYLAYLGSGLVAAELLGAFNALTRLPLACWWIAYMIAGFATAALLRPTRPRGRSLRLSPLVLGAVAAFVLVLAFLFWLGTVAAPNNLDAMNYHLPRAAVWATNHNVNNYATNIDKQTYDGRLAEYFITQILVLDGTDRLVFLPQFLAYAMLSVLVAGLARFLGGGRRAALWGLLLAGTLPVALMQATTTENDLVVASAILATYFLGAVLWRFDRIEPAVLVLCGAGAGLAIVTKADAVLVLVPFGVALIASAWLRRWISLRQATWVVFALAACIALSLPMTLRNWDLYRNPAGPPTGLDVGSLNPAGLVTAGAESTLSNVDSLYYRVNVHIDNVERFAGGALGWDRVNPKFGTETTWPVATPTPTEDGSGDFVAYLAIVAAALLLLSPAVRCRVFRSGTGLVPTLLSSTAGLALILLLLKWQPWGARFQLMALYPLLACVAIILSAIRERMIALVVGAVLIGLSVILAPMALSRDIGKPVFGDPPDYLSLPRDAQYFRWCAGLQSPYTTAVKEVFDHHQTSLGYLSQADDFEYPLWVLMSQQADGKPVHIVALHVMNASRRYEPRPLNPPKVALVSGTTVADENANASAILRLGYRPQSVSSSACATVGIYFLTKSVNGAG